MGGGSIWVWDPGSTMTMTRTRLHKTVPAYSLPSPYLPVHCTRQAHMLLEQPSCWHNTDQLGNHHTELILAESTGLNRNRSFSFLQARILRKPSQTKQFSLQHPGHQPEKHNSLLLQKISGSKTHLKEKLFSNKTIDCPVLVLNTTT